MHGAHAYDESLRLRVADDDWQAAQSRQGDDAPAGTPSVLAKTVTVSSYPTSAGVFYGVQAESVFGTESEGSSGTLTTIANTFYALNLGGTVPPSGTPVICTFTGNRWVFRFDT